MHSSNITVLKTSLILKIRFSKYLFGREKHKKWLLLHLKQLLCLCIFGVSSCVWIACWHLMHIASWLLFRTVFAKSSEVYQTQGQFQYNHSDFTPEPIQQSIYLFKGFKHIYSGQLKEGTEIKEGIGIVVISNGAIYEGFWKNDTFNGKGRFIWDTGEYYIGDWKDGKRHGYGDDYYTSGGRYEGEWKDGNKHGKGVDYFADGNRYEGEYRDGKKNGQGTLYWADGIKYTGEWKDGYINGQGTHYFTDGSRWTGEWKNNRTNGFGTDYAADGTVLRSGNWLDDEYFEPK